MATNTKRKSAKTGTMSRSQAGSLGGKARAAKSANNQSGGDGITMQQFNALQKQLAQGARFLNQAGAQLTKFGELWGNQSTTGGQTRGGTPAQHAKAGRKGGQASGGNQQQAATG